MKYSTRLGEISESQFQKALDTFNLGKFIKAEPVTEGLFGQNVFLTSDKGRFVFRGKPHYPRQFKNEKFMVDSLKNATNVPVPYPYLLDTAKETFGWEYVIMPRMKGRTLSDDLDEPDLSPSDRMEIARAQGRILKEAQKLQYPYCGEFDLASNSIKPCEPDWFASFSNRVTELMIKAGEYNTNTTAEDLEWVERIISEAEDAIGEFTPVFHMQDFKPGNMVVDKEDGKWQVTGLFDFMEASFGHPEADLSRMYAVYAEKKRLDLAHAFTGAYLSPETDMQAFKTRFMFFLIHDRAIIWEWVQRTGNQWWDKSWPFRKWVESFI